MISGEHLIGKRVLGAGVVMTTLAALVDRILKMVDRNEYKRSQAAPCLRVTDKAFGFGRRLPIVQGWR